MKRKILSKLVAWKEASSRKPLVLQGVRQCGKTYTLCQFGEQHFKKCLYFNFEKEPQLSDIFKYDYDTRRILHELAIHYGVNDIDISNTLIIFDEIQECLQAVTSLKYFCEDHPGMYLAAAGSLLGPAIAHNGLSFPVGKVEFLTMYPMSLEEFMLAIGMEKELAIVDSYSPTRSLPDSIAERMRVACKTFYVVGGMPEAVEKWIETHNIEAVEKVHDDILNSYANDFGKYLSPTDALKVSWIWNSVPVQLAKENNKFVFSHVKQGKRAAELEDALYWLNKAGMIYQLEHVASPQLPLSFYADATYFKVYLCDVGLLRRMSGLSQNTIMEETPLYTNFKGALTENFVMNELIKQSHKPYFWRSGNSAEVDFLIESDERIVPLETKAEGNTKAKSFKLYCSRYQPPLGFLLSMNNVGDNLVGETLAYSFPLYCIWRLGAYLHS